MQKLNRYSTPNVSQQLSQTGDFMPYKQVQIQPHSLVKVFGSSKKSFKSHVTSCKRRRESHVSVGLTGQRGPKRSGEREREEAGERGSVGDGE
ncbi:hypothetical protein PanWU01x14_025250 [Parasponia andersonii]|uniref:Uncharacterized protein n=1 Tax=Parasponia andersonii TaxID=3476 RepID=A0A2P5DWX0_PARAD|nr:hypothetical protein PanWU01x14_025250 [Parasponia andersonii]